MPPTPRRDAATRRGDRELFFVGAKIFDDFFFENDSLDRRDRFHAKIVEIGAILGGCGRRSRGETTIV